MPTVTDPLVLATVAVLGLVVGSFLNVCIWRLPLKQSVVLPRSYCPACERRLAWWEMLPVVSYVALGGRCRTCRKPISPVYPLVEAGTAGLYVASVVTWGLSWPALSGAVFGSLLIVVAFIDLRHGIIPDAISLPGIVAGVAFSALNPNVGIVASLIGLVAGGGFLLLAGIVGDKLLVKKAAATAAADGGAAGQAAATSEESTESQTMGGGDVKLAAMMGAFLGWAGLVTGLLAGFVAGALVGGFLMLSRLRKGKDPIPFGPFLAAGGLAAAFWGPAVIGWYLRVFWG